MSEIRQLKVVLIITGSSPSHLILIGDGINGYYSQYNYAFLQQGSYQLGKSVKSQGEKNVTESLGNLIWVGENVF